MLIYSHKFTFNHISFKPHSATAKEKKRGEKAKITHRVVGENQKSEILLFLCASKHFPPPSLPAFNLRQFTHGGVYSHSDPPIFISHLFEKWRSWQNTGGWASSAAAHMCCSQSRFAHPSVATLHKNSVTKYESNRFALSALIFTAMPLDILFLLLDVGTSDWLTTIHWTTRYWRHIQGKQAKWFGPLNLISLLLNPQPCVRLCGTAPTNLSSALFLHCCLIIVLVLLKFNSRFYPCSFSSPITSSALTGNTF